ncbi:hypothetical protein FXO38_25300 [Capsicum annuum]|uniref:Uncharacterized protein n=1 Tax=Capsicum annuum TaxID=4072 RepID=A0A2G2Y477_CAPAN|nr:hypothetical protein FXO38_25300 [Capsicum annuum]KAF3639839.1 hypothetical protein FXO37_23795 [Capsicum annuum]PHT64534.1 hypothetical protein T459_31602 [Capsicum annuum]
MEILFNVVFGFVFDVAKFVSKCIYPKLENIVRFSSKFEKLRKEMEKIATFRDTIKEKVEGAEEKATNQNQMLSSGSKIFASCRKNGNLCKKALQWL